VPPKPTPHSHGSAQHQSVNLWVLARAARGRKEGENGPKFARHRVVFGAYFLQPTFAAYVCSLRLQPTFAAYVCSLRLQPTSDWEPRAAPPDDTHHRTFCPDTGLGTNQHATAAEFAVLPEHVGRTKPRGSD
jgi:hypothetical protein